ncbi:hypothetical protein QZH41_003642 [Actinostola sp. cb2023]|nr:hypothetical protein QZH41_003642 [Actinostola sp. cb2023]
MDSVVYMNGLDNLGDKKMSLKRVVDRKTELASKVKELEKLEQSLTRQQQDLEYITACIKNWAKDFDKVPRNNQGVPYVRNVKEIASQISRLLNDIHGDFYFRMQNLVTADVPCFKQVYEGLEILKKQLNKILHDDVPYKASFIEEIRQLLGRLTGITSTMLDIYFEK